MAKALLALGLVVTVLVYLLIVELGVNAGRIHYGVRVPAGVDVGGLSEAEAREALAPTAELMAREPILLDREGIGLVSVYPRAPEPQLKEHVRAVGWRPRVEETIAKAMGVGRAEGPIEDLAARLDAWWGGVKVGWQGRPNARKVTKVIDYVQARATLLDLELNRPKLRVKIRRALNSWPRKPSYKIPLS